MIFTKQDLFIKVKTLIIKTGAAGDVVRTSCLLGQIAGDVYWVSSSPNSPILDDRIASLKIFSIEEAYATLAEEKFSKIISLEEDLACANLANALQTEELIGVYEDAGKLNYTVSSSSWFDMSRISRYGHGRANELKAANRKSWQEHLFSMLDVKFNDEPYRIYRESMKENPNVIVGIEKRAGERWPNKRWSGYDDLVRRLADAGVETKVFTQHKTIRDYMREIDRCTHVVCGDTFAMHAALAYRKPCVAIFNCTSPWEIYDYGFLTKVVSPLLMENFYSSSFDEKVVSSVSVDEVYNSIYGLIK